MAAVLLRTPAAQYPCRHHRPVFKRAYALRVTMSAQAYKYVVVGGGNASGTVAREFVAQGIKPGELAIIGSEPVVAYERPALSKAYLAPTGAARLPGFFTTVGSGGDRQAPEWYAEKGITFKTGSTVTAVDVKEKKVSLANGESVSYEKLILATGSDAVRLSDFKTPGADLEGVLYLRSEAEAAALVKAIEGLKASGGQAVVVGGGYIGMEVAAGLANNQVPTTVIFPEDKLMARLLTPQLAEFYEGYYQNKGVKLMKGSMVTAVKGTDGKVSSVSVSNKGTGEVTDVPANLVVVGVGARPSVGLVKDQLELVPPPVGGIKVDGYFKTSDPDVYAIGDVAAFPMVRQGGNLARQEHVTHARLSAAHAVHAILGKAQPYDYLPYFYSRIFGLNWQFWGFQGTSAAKVVHFGDASKPGAYWVENGKVIGVFLESATPEEAAAAKKVAQDQPPATDALATEGIKFAMSRM